MLPIQSGVTALCKIVMVVWQTFFKFELAGLGWQPVAEMMAVI
jgi:hypothetical protein